MRASCQTWSCSGKLGLVGTVVVLGESNNGEALSPRLSMQASPRNDRLQSVNVSAAAAGALASQTLLATATQETVRGRVNNVVSLQQPSQ